MTGVERIKQYGSLDKEGEEHTSEPLPPNWPTEGAITYDHVTLIYLPDHPPALNDLTFSLNGQEKVN